jgi:carotenoid cleavage dioxygenase-like enzyme
VNSVYHSAERRYGATVSIDERSTANPWLSGYQAPVTHELDVADLRVTGHLPQALRGRYVRNGPNPAFAPLGRYHPFDGDGMLHAVELGDGGASYRNRWIDSAGLGAERRAGHSLFGGLSDWKLPSQEVMDEVGMMKHTANTHVVGHAGRTLALMEASPPTEVDAALSTLGLFTFDGALAGAMTAHPKTDPETGELVFFGYSPLPPYLRYHVADAAGQIKTSIEVDLPQPVMMHDFAVSHRHVAFFDLPAVFDLQAMLSGGEGIRWEPSAGARIGVLDRSAPEAGVRWFEVDPFYVFHFLNAHDAVDAAGHDVLVVEGCRADRLGVNFGDDVIEESVVPMLHRWKIDLTAGTVTDEPLDDQAGDFPRINDRFAGLDTRYGYLGHPRSWDDDRNTEVVEFEGVTKYDLQSGTSTTYSYGDRALTGETCFVPDPTRTGEDDGWLVALVHDPDENESTLRVVDAQALEEVARVHLPQRVPFGFHGSWFPAT